MNNNTTAPTYTLRGLQLIGWRDMQARPRLSVC